MYSITYYNYPTIKYPPKKTAGRKDFEKFLFSNNLIVFAFSLSGSQTDYLGTYCRGSFTIYVYKRRGVGSP